MARLIPGSYSVVLSTKSYYAFDYDWKLPVRRPSVWAELLAGLMGPLLLGRLLCQAEGFIFLGELGFLTMARDSRSFEFDFIKAHGGKIVCYFVGTDIRSPMLLREKEKETGLISLGTQLVTLDPKFGSEMHERSRRELARVAEEFADAIFSYSVDQLSYLKSPTIPVTYFFPDEDFVFNEEKFENPKRIVVVHAPSSPEIKGTALVRTAIQNLKSAGYDFEYVELIGVDNESVRRTLASAHIVLNQFYAYVPGVFGIEALASNCVVLMSADERVEPDLPKGSNLAWIVTTYEQVEENLKRVLDHPSQMAGQAKRGQNWALENVSFSKAGPRFREELDRLLPNTR